MEDVFPREGRSGKPDYPPFANRNEIEGTVVAKIKVINCNVDVVIVKGPNVFHSTVINFIKRYKCIPHDQLVEDEQTFTFTLGR